MYLQNVNACNEWCSKRSKYLQKEKADVSGKSWCICKKDWCFLKGWCICKMLILMCLQRWTPGRELRLSATLWEDSWFRPGRSKIFCVKSLFSSKVFSRNCFLQQCTFWLSSQDIVLFQITFHCFHCYCCVPGQKRKPRCSPPLPWLSPPSSPLSPGGSDSLTLPTRAPGYKYIWRKMFDDR